MSVELKAYCRGCIESPQYGKISLSSRRALGNDTEILKDLTADLAASMSAVGPVSVGEQSLQILCKDCQSVAVQLTETVFRLRTESTSDSEKLFKTLRRNEEFDRLMAIGGRLAGIRQQLMTLMSASFSPSTAHFHSLSIGGTMEKKHAPAFALQTSYAKEDYHQSKESSYMRSPAAFSKSVATDFNAKVFPSFFFNEMPDRHETIPLRYKFTYEWMLQDVCESHDLKDSLLDWLRGRTTDNMCWITGVPGAGKSTLMKFISDDSRTREIAWTLDELRRALTVLFHQGHQRTFLIFIDGLDEFSGNASDVIALLIAIAAAPNVKLCIASRQWTVFEDAFGRLPSLRMQDLTRPDIRNYTNQRLRDHPTFEDFQIEEPQYASRVVEQIVEKSSGVFLWVTLVVNSLLEGLTNGDRVTDLQMRVDDFPPELEKLFRKMLNGVEARYKQESARLFELIWQTGELPFPEQLTLLRLSYASEGSLESTFSLPSKSVHHETLSAKAERMRRRLNSQSKGFLEATFPHRQATATPGNTDKSAQQMSGTERGTKWKLGIHGQVQYLHRTVKRLHGQSFHFDASIHLAASSLSHLKTARRIPADRYEAFVVVFRCIDCPIIMMADHQVRGMGRRRGPRNFSTWLSSVTSAEHQGFWMVGCLFSSDQCTPERQHRRTDKFRVSMLCCRLFGNGTNDNR
ncbi:hypothetical protein BKA63DRAFT_581471 [Paraphoma chrysanthemicola]|nr:hypothetical protein BKA63DRAFT_581471 [Paraphoma chrysanthemicola]